MMISERDYTRFEDLKKEVPKAEKKLSSMRKELNDLRIKIITESMPKLPGLE